MDRLLWICCFGVQALFVVDAKLQQILVFGGPVSVSLARSLLVPSRLNVLGCPTENMFGFLLGQQLPDKLPTILPPTQGNLLAPAVFMCSFVVLADLYVLGVVPAAGPFLVCAFVFVFEVSLGEQHDHSRSACAFSATALCCRGVLHVPVQARLERQARDG